MGATSRLQVVENMIFKPLDEVVIYDAFTKDDDLIYSIAIQGQYSYKESSGKSVSKLLTEITTTLEFGDKRKIGQLVVKNKFQGCWLSPDTKLELSPMEAIGISFTNTGDSQLLFDGESIPALEGVPSAKIVRRIEKGSKRVTH